MLAQLDVTPPGIVRSNLELFLKHFGDDAQALEARLVKHLKNQPYTDPFAHLPHLVATVSGTDGRRPQRAANTFHSPALAQKWIKETIDKLPAEHRAAAKSAINTFPNRAQAQAFATQWRTNK